jgi:plasmid stabilization system protein ParE
MRLELSTPALADLDEILGFLSERSQLGAVHVEARRRRAFGHNVDFPEAAQIVEQRPRVRRHPRWRYP